MKALVIGASGMDGMLMTSLLLNKGYEVIGSYCTIKPHIKYDKLTWVKLDLSDNSDVLSIRKMYPLDIIFNFGGVSFSPDATRMPDYAEKVNYSSVMKILEYMTKFHPNTKFFQASSSEVFGLYKNTQLDLKSKRDPFTKYGYCKNMVDMMCNYLREEGYSIYNAITFNHEYKTRPLKFITRKIANYVAKETMKMNADKLYLGDINARRDWGYAPDYVVGFYNQTQVAPCELLFSTDTTHSVRDILEISFGAYGLHYEQYISIKSEFIRGNEYDNVWGDSSETRNKIDFNNRFPFKDIILEMVNNDINKLKSHA